MAGTVGTTTIDKQIFEMQVRDKASKEVTAIDKKVKSLQKRFLDMATKVAKSLTGTLLKAITGLAKKGWKLLTKSFTDAVKAAIKFQDAILRTHQALGILDKGTTSIERAIRNLSLEIGGIPLNTLARISGIAATVGLKGTANITEFTKAIAQLTVATDVVATTAAAQIPAILTVFGVATSDMGRETRRLADMITHLGFTFNATQSQIMSVMTTLSGAAVTSKLTMEEFAALATTVASVEKRFHTGGAAIQQILQRMATKSVEWAEILKLNFDRLSYVIENKPLDALKMIFNALVKIQQGSKGVQRVNEALKEMKITGVRAGGVLLKMTQQINTLDRATIAASSAQGALSRAYGIAMDTFSKQWQKTKNIWGEILLFFGEPFVEELTAFIKTDFNPWFDNLRKWITTNSSIKVTWENLIETVFEGLDSLLDKTKEYWEILQLKGPWAALKKMGEDAWGALSQAATDAWIAIVALFDPEGSGGKKFNATLESMNQGLQDLSTIASAVAQALDAIKAAWDFLIIEGLVEKTADAIIAIEDATRGHAEAVEQMGRGLQDSWTAWDKVKNAAQQTAEATEQVVDVTKKATEQTDKLAEASAKTYDIVGRDAQGRPSHIELKSGKGWITVGGRGNAGGIGEGGPLDPETTSGRKERYDIKGGYMLTGKSSQAAKIKQMADEFQLMDLSIEQTVNTLERFGASLGFARDEVQTLAEIAYKKSVFPDISKWLQKNKDDVTALDTEINNLTIRMKNVAQGPFLPWARKSSDELVQMNIKAAGMTNALRRLQLARARAAAAASAPQVAPVNPGGFTSSSNDSGQVGGLGSPGTTIIFQGTNVVDESSKTRFVRELVKTSSNLRSHVVFG